MMTLALRLLSVAGALTSTLWLTACVPPDETCVPPDAPLSLVDHNEWQRVSMDDDPFEPGTGDEIYVCEDRDMGVEQLGDERTWTVTTGSCNWATVAQPLSRELHEGDRLRVELFWFSQTDFPGGLATVGLAIGDVIVLTHEVQVPAEGELLDVTIDVPSDVTAGTPICFHVGNHGSNSWNLLDVTLVEDAPALPVCEGEGA